jgi:hypothetical protein
MEDYITINVILVTFFDHASSWCLGNLKVEKVLEYSFWHEITAAIWVTNSDADLALYLAPASLGLHYMLQCCKGFFLSVSTAVISSHMRYNSDVSAIVSIYCHVHRRCMDSTLQTILQACCEIWHLHIVSTNFQTADLWNCRQAPFQLSYAAFVTVTVITDKILHQC